MTRRITVDVYEADNTTYVGTLGSDKGRQWLDDLSAEGSHQIESHLDHADQALLADGRVLRFKIDGTPRWAGLVEDRNIVLADPSARQSGRVIGASGRGLLAIFDDAVVLPELGFGRISPDTRYMGWMSRYYDHSGWGNAVELKQQSDPDDTKPWFGAPRGWPDPDAYWVGPTDGDVPGADPGGGTPGDIYFWGDYEVPSGEGGDYTAYTTADDGFELYRDGDREAAESRVALWGETRTMPMQFDEGDHSFGYKLTNFDRPNPSTNVTAMILSLAKMLGGGIAAGDVVARSSAGTKMLAFPASEPGMTAGHIMLSFIAENQAIDWHPDLTCDFDEFEDSDGVSWSVELNRAYAVGSSLSGVMRELTDSHVAEFAMDPVGKVLHAYVSKGADRTASVAATYGVNISKLGMRHVGPGKNSGLARTAEGRWMLIDDPAAVTAYGRRLVGMSVGSAPSIEAAEQQVLAALSDTANPIDAITDLQVESDPFIDGTVETGDLVTSSTVGGSDTFRVHGLRFSEDAAGRPIVTPELVQTDPVEVPAGGLIRLYADRADVDETTTPDVGYYDYEGIISLHWSVEIPPFDWPAGTDGTFSDLSIPIVDPLHPGWIFVADIYPVGAPIDPSEITGGFTYDNTTGFVGVSGLAASLSGGVTVYGADFLPNVAVWDGTFATFDGGFEVPLDPASDPSWL